MTLRTRLVLSVTIGFTGGAALLEAYTRDSVIGGFSALEIDGARDRALATSSLVRELAEEFRAASEDWAIWTEAVDFACGGGEDFVANNMLVETFVTKKWHHLGVVRSPGHVVVYAGAFDDGLTRDAVGAFTALLASDRVVTLPQRERKVAGFALVDGAPHVVASTPLRNSDGAVGACRGAVVYTLRLDEAWAAEVGEMTSRELRLVPLVGAVTGDRETARAALADGVDVWTAPSDLGGVRSWSRLDDLWGRPVALVEIDHPRTLSAAGAETARWLDLGVLAFGVWLVGGSLAFLRAEVLRPVADLTQLVGSLVVGRRRPRLCHPAEEFGDIEHGFEQMAAAVTERGAALERARAVARAVLDQIGDGLILCDLNGDILVEVSAPARAWFGPASGRVWDYVAGPGTPAAALIELGIQQVGDDILPLDACLDQLPRRVVRDGRTFDVAWRAVETAGRVDRLLLVVADASHRVERERENAFAREIEQLLLRTTADRGGFRAFEAEGRALLAIVATTSDEAERTRALHSLKGNAAIFGFATVASLVHRIEDERAELIEWRADQGDRLWQAWDGTLARLRAEPDFVADDRVEVPAPAVAALLASLDGTEAGLSRWVQTWGAPPVQWVLDDVRRAAEAWAVRSGVPVEVVVTGADFRVDTAACGALWGGLDALVRGLIAEGARRVEVDCTLTEDDCVVTVRDDCPRAPPGTIARADEAARALGGRSTAARGTSGGALTFFIPLLGADGSVRAAAAPLVPPRRAA